MTSDMRDQDTATVGPRRPDPLGTLRRHGRDAWHVVAPARDDPHGPLPPLLLVLTFVTGLIDAFSYLALGHVLVANMTGNIVFLAFAISGAPGFLWWASVLAILSFLAGAVVGGRVVMSRGQHRGALLLGGALCETVLVAVAFVLSLIVQMPLHDAQIVAFVLVLGIALGIQNATARALGVPDLTTTVLTLTITGIASDSALAGGSDSRVGRRLVSITAMFAGALTGGLLAVHGHFSLLLGGATVILALVTAAAVRHARSGAPWVHR